MNLPHSSRSGSSAGRALFVSLRQGGGGTNQRVLANSPENGWAGGGADMSGCPGLALLAVSSIKLEADVQSIGCAFVVGRVSSVVSSCQARSIIVGSASTRAISCEGCAFSPSNATPRGTEKRFIPSQTPTSEATKGSARNLGSVFLKNGCSLRAEKTYLMEVPD
jgi:hypothetical protein